jgi:hypothetical protein
MGGRADLPAPSGRASRVGRIGWRRSRGTQRRRWPRCPLEASRMPPSLPCRTKGSTHFTKRAWGTCDEGSRSSIEPVGPRDEAQVIPGLGRRRRDWTSRQLRPDGGEQAGGRTTPGTGLLRQPHLGRRAPGGVAGLGWKRSATPPWCRPGTRRRKRPSSMPRTKSPRGLEPQTVALLGPWRQCWRVGYRQGEAYQIAIQL